LSSTTTASALRASLFSVSSELYGCTTTSGELSQLGNTEYVCEEKDNILEVVRQVEGGGAL